MNSENALTRAYAANLRGDAFTLPLDAVDATGTDDFIAYIKNNSDRKLVLYRLFMELAADSTMELVRCNNVAVAGTFIITEAVSLSGAGGAPVQAVTSLDLTGIAASQVVKHFNIDVTGGMSLPVEWLFPDGIIVLPGKNIALRDESGAGVVSGGIDFFLETPAGG
jgi:hypothetical protein